MNEDLAEILDWLHPGKANLGYRVEWRPVEGFVIAAWDTQIMGEPQPTETEILSHHSAWLVWRDSAEGIAIRNHRRLPTETVAALVEVVASERAGETPPAWAVDLLTQAQTDLRNG